VSESLEGALVTGTSEEARTRIYLLRDGEKRWVMSPEVFYEQGWSYDDVRTLSDADLAAIPTSQKVVGEHLQFAGRDAARQRASAPFLAGRGIELGAGIYPQALPNGVEAELFELNDPGEVARLFATHEAHLPEFRALEAIPERFPDGADFLIAHNVLEHCADPIATLIMWASHVRDGGALVLSVPCVEFCPDKGRLVPGLDHVLFDYLFSRTADTFESREHAYSCTAGWMNTWEEWLPLDKLEVASLAHEVAHAKDLDVHWHAFTPELFDGVVQAASHFGERVLHPMAWADPDGEDEDERTVGDAIGVLRVGGTPREGDVGFRFAPVGRALDDARGALERALEKLRT
jgi:SAM-dependent methyltransferase